MFRNRINDAIRCRVAANYTKIKPQTGKCRYNHQCHHNAVHDALMKNHDRIALVVYFDCGQPIVHFINTTKKGGYKDNTLGVWSSQHEHYFVRWIYKNEFKDVHQIHRSMRKTIKSFVPFWLKAFFRYTDC